MKHFGKWCVINQVVREMHPLGLSVIDILKSENFTDEIYKELVENHQMGKLL